MTRFPPKLADSIWYQIGLCVFGLVVVVAMTHRAPDLCNDTSRLATAQSLVERGTFVIDDSHFAFTCDKIKIDGHFYSDKPPLQSIYLAGVYGVLSTVFDLGIPDDLGLVYYLTSLFSSGLAFVLALLGAYRLARRFGVRRSWSAATAVFGCAGTLFLPFSLVVSSHAFAAPFLVWLAALVAPSDGEAGGDGSQSRLRDVGVGVCTAAAGLVEPLVGVVALPLLAVYLWRSWNWRALLGVAAGGALLGVPHAWICYAISGNPILLNLNPAHFDFEGSMHTAENLSGVGFGHDSFGALAEYAYHSTFGYEGAVVTNPPAAIGAVSLTGLWWWRPDHRGIWGAVLVGIVGFLVLTIGWTSNYSGSSYGIRWHATPAPLLSAFGAVAIDAASDRLKRWLGTLFVVAGVAGGAVAGIGTINPWATPVHDDYAFTAIFSNEPKYVAYHVRRAVSMAKKDKYWTARHHAEEATRREPTQGNAWMVAIESSARIGDLQRLRAYRRRFADDTTAGADRIRTAVEQALREAESRE